MRFQLKLDRIELTNFRLFEKVSLTFDDKLTVLIGENGAGKTALLEGVAKALNLYIGQVQTSVSQTKWNDVYRNGDIRHEQKEAQTTLSVKLDETDKYQPEQGTPEYFDAMSKTHSNEERIQAIEAEIEKLDEEFRNTEEQGPAEAILEEINSLSRQKAKLEEEDIEDVEDVEDEDNELSWTTIKTAKTADVQQFAKANELKKVCDNLHHALRRDMEVSVPVVVFYPTDRTTTTVENLSEDDLEVSVFMAYDHALDGLSLDYGRFLEWFVWQDQMSQFRKEENKTLSVVKEAILTMLNDEGAEKIFTDMYIDPSRFKQPRLMVEKSGTKLEVAQMSSGERSLFVLVGDLARRLCLANPYADNPLDGQGIVLIDEVDLHLHPRWQRKVLVQLQATFPNIQWVVATHSPTLLTHLEQAKLYRIFNGGVYPLRHFMGMDIRDIYYALYGIEARPLKWQEKINELYSLLDNEKSKEASQKLKELSQTLSDDDPVIIEAKTSLELMSL